MKSKLWNENKQKWCVYPHYEWNTMNSNIIESTTEKKTFIVGFKKKLHEEQATHFDLMLHVDMWYADTVSHRKSRWLE